MITTLFYCFILLIANSNIDDSTKMIFKIVFAVELWFYTIMLIK